ncbi:MAG: hypothetical protein LBK72_07910 [Bifidobacteriaceae bacterium]|jgi:hypothetical protein|nr:hypothetical protein [Bifidobacteriaceae bacterium]
MSASEPDLPPQPIVWEALASHEATREWPRLNDWVEDLRHIHLIEANTIPPCWHRHPILVEHLVALRSHWLTSHIGDHASAPFVWLSDLAGWEPRIRQIVARLGCKPGTCRTPQLALWPGETEPDPAEAPPQFNPTDRDKDFDTYTAWDIQRRQIIEDTYRAMILATLDTDDQGSGQDPEDDQDATG